MPAKSVTLANPAQIRPFGFQSSIGRTVIRLTHWLAEIVFGRKAGVKINVAPNIVTQNDDGMEMNATVFVPFSDDDPAWIALGKFIGQEGMEPALGFVPVAQVAEFSAEFNVPNGEGDKPDAFWAEGGGQPFDVLHQGISLFPAWPRQGFNCCLTLLLTCNCYS